MSRRALALLCSAAIAASIAQRIDVVADFMPIVACFCQARERIAAVR